MNFYYLKRLVARAGFKPTTFAIVYRELSPTSFSSLMGVESDEFLLLKKIACESWI